MAIQKLELLQLCEGGVGPALHTKAAVFCAPFFVQNTNSNVILNHPIEEEFQSPSPFFSGGLDMKSRCKLIQVTLIVTQGHGLWLTRNLTRSSSLLVVH